MKLTLKGALDLSRSINNQSIWNKRSVDFFNDLGRDLVQDAKDRLRLPPSPQSKSSKSTGKAQRSIYFKKLGNTNVLRMSKGISLATSAPYAPFIHGKPIYRSFRPIKRTRPFFPPYKEGSSLAAWAKRGQPKMNAFLVARKISKTGLKMKPFIGGTVFEREKEIKDRGEQMLEKIAQDNARKIN